MTVTIQPVTPSFAAEVGDIDLGRPISPQDLAAIKQAFTRYAVLVFPDQTFSDESHLDFARHFGPLETSVFKLRTDHKMRLHEQMADVGNLDANDNILDTNDRVRLYQLGNRLWHTDSSFKRVPAYCSLLHGRAIPPIGGHTEFADLRAAYDALPEATRRRIEGLVAEHSLMTSRARLGFTDFDEIERKARPPRPVGMQVPNCRVEADAFERCSHVGCEQRIDEREKSVDRIERQRHFDELLGTDDGVDGGGHACPFARASRSLML